MSTYQEFLATKWIGAKPHGIEPGALHSALFDFQADAWASPIMW